MGTTKTTASGLEASQIKAMPFYKAAFALDIYADNQSMDPISLLSDDPYYGTSYAVWTLAGEYKIKDSEVLSVAGIGKQLLDAADDPNASVLNSEPTVTPQLTQNAVFTYEDDDKKWHSSPITLSADGISTRFTVTVSGDGKAVDSSGNEVTEIKAGDSFSLISDSEPEEKTEVSVSSSVPWMDENGLVVYEPDPSAVAPDDNSFQNMVGVVIHTEKFTASTTVQKGVSLTFTKKWVDDNNASGKRPDASSYAKSLTLLAEGKELSGYEPEITDNGNNTYTVSYKGLPKILDGKTVTYSVKEAAVEGYTSESSAVSDGGTLVNTLIVPTPSPMATATVTENKSAPMATVKMTENKPVPAAVKAVPATGLKSSYGENSH